MSDTASTTEHKKKTTRTRKVRLTELDEFRMWLEGLGYQSAPKIHVNGIQHGTAVVVVDFGTPLHETTKLSSEQSAELINHLRITTKSLYKDREVNMRVLNDSSAGIWWSTVA